MLQESATLKRAESAVGRNLECSWIRHTPDDVVQTGVCELRGPVVVVHKVDAAGHGASDLPPHWQRAEFLAAHAGQIPTPESEDVAEHFLRRFLTQTSRFYNRVLLHSIHVNRKYSQSQNFDVYNSCFGPSSIQKWKIPQIRTGTRHADSLNAVQHLCYL